MIKRNTLGNNVLSLYLGLLINYISPLIILAYLVRTLSLETYGKVGLGYGISTFVFVLLDLGFSISATSYIAKNFRSLQKISNYISSVFLVKIIFILVAFSMVCLYGLLTNTHNDLYVLFFLSTLPPIFQSLSPVWFFQGIEKMKVILNYTGIIRVSSIVLIFFLVKRDGDYLWVPLCQGVSQLLGLMYLLQGMFKFNIKISLPKYKLVKNVVITSYGIFISKFVSAIMMNSGVFILKFFSSFSDVAIYSIAEQIFKSIQAASSPILTSAHPYLIGQGKLPEYLRILIVSTLLLITLVTLSYFISPKLINVFLGQVDPNVIRCINIFYLVAICDMVSSFFGYPLATFFNKKRLVIFSIYIGLLIFLVALFLFIYCKNISPENLCVSILIAQFSIMLIRFIKLSPLITDRIKKRLDI